MSEAGAWRQSQASVAARLVQPLWGAPSGTSRQKAPRAQEADGVDAPFADRVLVLGTERFGVHVPGMKRGACGSLSGLGKAEKAIPGFGPRTDRKVVSVAAAGSRGVNRAVTQGQRVRQRLFGVVTTESDAGARQRAPRTASGRGGRKGESPKLESWVFRGCS
jgi:hypothetical protein